MAPAAPASLAVIGAGVAGCALLAQLGRLGFRGPMSLWETGRGAGGRAGSRRSRSDGLLVIDHGAPLLNITTTPAPALLDPLLEGGWIQPWAGPVAMLEGESRLNIGRPDALGMGSLFHGAGGMDQLSQGLLQLAGEAPIEHHYGTLVRFLERPPEGPWRLLAADGTLLGEADWLVLTGTLLAHPRSRLILGWDEVPLARVAARLADLQLDHVLACLAGIRFEARTNLLLVFDPQQAEVWRALPFALVNFDAAAQQRWSLRRLTMQGLADGRCAVVAHSSAAFAADHLDVVGSRSAVARLLPFPLDDSREERVIALLRDAVHQCLSPWLSGLDLHSASAQLMRWGAAFPVAPGLPTELMLCRSSHLGFCGDFVAGPGFGRIEGALRSAELLADQLQQLLSASGAGSSGTSG
jgi:predicted NAD/FAD-dependent oxidoreductase